MRDRAETWPGRVLLLHEMKKPERQKKKRPAVADPAELNRLERISEFERDHLGPWLEYMAELAGAAPEDILAAIAYGVTEGFVIDYKGVPGNCSYRLHRRFRGHTPIEAAAVIFIVDHWRLGPDSDPFAVKLPRRPINFNVKRGPARAAIFSDTLRYGIRKPHSSPDS